MSATLVLVVIGLAFAWCMIDERMEDRDDRRRWR